MRLIEGSRSSVGVGVCSIGGVLRGNSLFSADGAAVGMMGVGCVVLSRVVCDLLVGRKASSCYSSSSSVPYLLMCELSRSCL